MTPTFHPFDLRHTDDPDDRVARLLAEEPVSTPIPGVRVVARDAAVRAVLRDPETFSSRATNTAVPHGDDELALSQLDPPAHTRLRRLAGAGFTPRALAGYAPAVRAHAERAASRVRARLDAEGRCDLVAAVTAGPDGVPAAVLADVLGCHGADRDAFAGWAAAFATLVGKHAHPDWPGFCARVGEWVAARRRAADPPPDLLTRLVRADVDGDALTDVEIRTFVHFLIVAGIRNVSLLIGNLVHRVLADGLWPELVADPSLVPAAVEESLRRDGPVLWSMRTAVTDTVVDGTAVPAGEAVVALAAGSNRDPRRWAEPDAFRLDREHGRGHVTFGHGPHVCLGAGLTRAQAGAVLTALVAAEPRLALADDFRFRRAGDLISRGPAALPVVRAGVAG